MDEDLLDIVKIVAWVVGIFFAIGMVIVLCNQHSQAEIAVCEVPWLVSETPDGLKLYAVRPGCGTVVYFSAAGTHTTHTEMVGKIVRTVDDDVSNGEVK